MNVATKDRCQKIEVTDMTTNQTTIYDSIRAAGRALDIKKKTFFFLIFDYLKI